jgi:sec-independent protein translocase protein TatB
VGGLLSAKFLVLLAIALVVLGPEKLPEAARTVGRVIAELRRISTGLQDQVRDAFEGNELAADLASPIQEWRATTESWRSSAVGWLGGSTLGSAASNDDAARADSAALFRASPPLGLGAGSGELGPPPGDPSLN